MAAIIRPDDLFDRHQEWRELSDFVTDPTPGLQIGIVYGRRRQGKSYPLRRLTSATGGFYYQALEHEPAQALSELGDRLGDHLGVGRLAFADWHEAVSSLRRLAPRGASGALGAFQLGVTPLGGASTATGPAVAVLDEFPYLLERSPELPSLLQRAVDASLDETSATRLILCGSAISVMSGLLEGQGALRGRVHTNLLINPFNHLDTRSFWGIDDPRLAFHVNAILGGTPGYRELVHSVPASTSELDAWVVEEVLSPSSALFREDEWLLGEQHGMEDRSLYLSVLTSVAEGNGTQTAIASQLRRSQQSVLHPLDGLVRAGFLLKDDDVLRKRRPVYRIADPMIRFHQIVRQPRTALFEDRRGADAWADARTSFESLVLGPHFEHLSREHIRRVGQSLFGVPIVAVGTTTVNDKEERAAHELDIVAMGTGTGPQHRIIEAIGEAKLRVLDVGDLARLERIRSMLHGADDVRMVLASASGFSDVIVHHAEARDDLHLIDLDAIYTE